MPQNDVHGILVAEYFCVVEVPMGSVGVGKAGGPAKTAAGSRENGHATALLRYASSGELPVSCMYLRHVYVLL